jgi:hypothetical protein
MGLRKALADIRAAGQDLDVEVLREALEIDFATLATDARAKWPDLMGSNSRVVVFLDRVDTWADALLLLFESPLLNLHGLGTKAEPVPVVMSCVMGTEGSSILGGAKGQTHLSWMPVVPFEAKSDEDTLAAEWVLLNPSRNPPWEIAAPVYAPLNPAATSWRTSFRRFNVGLPGQLNQRELYVWASTLAGANVFTENNDELTLDGWERRQ